MNNESIPCVGWMGKVLGHCFGPRFDTKQDYPPGTMDAMRDSLARVTSNPLRTVWDDIGKVCEGYRGMDTNETIYLYDVCARCGHTRFRSVISEQAPSVAIPPALTVVKPEAAPEAS